MGTPGQIVAGAALSGYDEGSIHKQQRKDTLVDEERRLKAEPIIAGSKQILANLPSIEDMYGKDSQQYKNAMGQLANHQQAFDELYHPIKSPGAIARDFHWLAGKVASIPRAVARKVMPASVSSVLPLDNNSPSWGQAQILKQQASSRQKAQQEAGLLAAGVPLSPQQQAMSEFRTKEVIQQAQIDSTLKIARNLGLSENVIDELKQQLVGLKNITPKPLTGEAGRPYKGPDGLYRQAVTNPDGTIGFRLMPPDWKPHTKAVAGTILNTKKYGYIKTWVDPYDPSKIIGFQKITPGRQYTGSTSSSTATDSMGVTTTTSRSTTPTNQTPVDIDLSGAQQVPDDFTGEELPETPSSPNLPGATSPTSGSPNKNSAPSVTPPPSVAHTRAGVPVAKSSTPAANPSTLKAQIPAPPPDQGVLQVDASGHIPDGDIQKRNLNPNLVQVANNILDGQDITKIPFKDRGAAERLAQQYGWRGQGMFTPREALQIKEGASFLNLMANSPTLKVLDKGFFSNLPMLGASPDPSKEGFFGRLSTNLAARSQSPEQQKFMDLYRQLDAMAIGLRALVQTGRGTQKQVDLLISELPNPYNTPSSADAKRRLQLVQKELEIAARTGHLPEVEQIQQDFTTSSPSSTSTSTSHVHKEGDTVMLHGHPVVIKKIYPDGTFDY